MINNKFKDVADTIYEIASAMNDSQKLKRLLKYNSNNPLELTAEQPDIMESLLDKGTNNNARIYIKPFSEDIITEVNSLVFISLVSGKISNRNNNGIKKNFYNEHFLSIEIVVDSANYNIRGEGGIRPLAIAGEIANIIDNKDFSTHMDKIDIFEYRSFASVKKKITVFSLYVNIATSNILDGKALSDG